MANDFDTFLLMLADEYEHQHKRAATWEYTNGLLPPRYPVPALKTEVEFMPDTVVLWTMDRTWKRTPLAVN